MAIGSQIQAWRLSRGFSPEHLAAEAGISLQALDEIEGESLDPSTGTLERLATAMKIPVAWLFAHPNAFDLLFHEPEEKDDTPNGPDPVTERTPELPHLGQAARKRLGVQERRTPPGPV